MTHVRLPDGSARELEAGASAADLAAQIGAGLAKAAVAARVNGEVVDLARPLPDGAEVAILTKKDPQALEVLRHSAAHLCAAAVLELFPDAQLGFGPPTETGFYYDFVVKEPFTPEELCRRLTGLLAFPRNASCAEQLDGEDRLILCECEVFAIDFKKED